MTNITTQLVHENEAQRRHARVKIPAKLIVAAKNGPDYQFNILDLSVSGFGVEANPNTLRGNFRYNGELQFKVNNVKFDLPVNFSVLYYDQNEKKAGCEFEQLGKEEISLLHLFISKFLSGELVTNADILSTIDRENFTKSRSKSKSLPTSGLRKVRTVIGTGVGACIGICAFIFIVTNLYNHFFITQATTAMVDINAETIASPADGYIQMLIGNDKKIGKGKPIAGISSPVLDYLNDINKRLADGDNLESLLPEQVHSVIKSPCDGIIIDNRIENDSYVKKGEPLFIVARGGDKPYIQAAFSYDDADNLPIGKKVTLQFPGEREKFNGVIEDIKVDINDSSSRLLAVIRPEIELPYAKVQKPVRVLVSPISGDLPFVAAASDGLSSVTTALAKAK